MALKEQTTTYLKNGFNSIDSSDIICSAKVVGKHILTSSCYGPTQQLETQTLQLLHTHTRTHFFQCQCIQHLENPDAMRDSLWILIVGILVFVLVLVLLLCFTKGSGDTLFLTGPDDPETACAFRETPALLATLSEDARISYEQAKGKVVVVFLEKTFPWTRVHVMVIVFQQRYPPNSIPTDITLSQLVSIQEKGVSAFEFELNMESNGFVSARTELQFLSGESCFQTNLPLPRNQDVYYWEVRIIRIECRRVMMMTDVNFWHDRQSYLKNQQQPRWLLALLQSHTLISGCQVGGMILIEIKISHTPLLRMESAFDCLFQQHRMQVFQ